MAGSNQAAGRPGQQHAYRVVRRLPRRHGVTRALHHGHRRSGKSKPQALQVAAHPRPDPGVQPGRHAALVLADLRQHARRQRHEQIVRQCRRDTLFGGGVEVGKQQVDRDGLRRQLRHLFAQRGQCVAGQRLEQPPLRIQPPAGLQATGRRHRRFDRCRLQLIQ